MPPLGYTLSVETAAIALDVVCFRQLTLEGTPKLRIMADNVERQDRMEGGAMAEQTGSEDQKGVSGQLNPWKEISLYLGREPRTIPTDERGWEAGRRSGVSARAHPRLYTL